MSVGRRLLYQSCYVVAGQEIRSGRLCGECPAVPRAPKHAGVPQALPTVLIATLDERDLSAAVMGVAACGADRATQPGETRTQTPTRKRTRPECRPACAS